MNQNNKNEKRIFTEEQIKEKLKARKNLLIVVSSLFFIIFVFFLLVTLANDLWEEDEFLPYAVIESFFIIISIITFIQYKKTDINSIKEEIEYDNHQKKLNFAYNDINANVVIILNERKKQYFYYNDVTNQWQYKLGDFVSKVYKYTDLINYELLDNNSIIFKKDSGRIISDDNLSGEAGLLADTSSNIGNDLPKSKKQYVFRIFVNDLQRAGVVFNCDNEESAYQITTTFSLLEKRIFEKDR